MLSLFYFTFPDDVCVYHFIDRFKQYKLLYEDVVLGVHRTSQYSSSVGEEHCLRNVPPPTLGEYWREHSNKEAHEILRVGIKCFVKKTYDQSLGRLGIRYKRLYVDQYFVKKDL